MPQITSPYNFVPLNREVYIPSWGEKVSMDIPFADGEDGIIEVQIENISPLFVRNGHSLTEEDNDNRQNPNTDDKFSSHINVDGQRRYFIPGSTIKGAVRNVMEVLSFARMDRYDNDSFGFRSFDTNRGENSAYAKAMKSVQVGWLEKVGESYQIHPCKGEVQTIAHSQIRPLFENFDKGRDHQTAKIKQLSVCQGDELYPIVSNMDGSLLGIETGVYRLVCTGYMNNKKHEYLFPTALGTPIPVSPEKFEQFDSIHRHTEYYGGKNGKDGFLKERLENGKMIPVFYRMINDDEIESIGITRMYRYPFENSVDDVRRHAQKDAVGRDLPTVIFGFADKENALKGRVHFGHAFCNQEIDDSLCPIVCGVLGEPRPSYYPLYLMQNTAGSYVNYSAADAKIAGRKRYRVHNGSTITPLNRNENNDSVNTIFRPIPAQNVFNLAIAVHNLKAVEVGALLSALTFNETPDTFHNIGLAKAFGYGKCKFTVTSMTGFHKSEEEYLKDFETEMFRFSKDHLHIQLSQDESIRRLLAIASPEHADEDIIQMDFNGCEIFKKNNNYSVLREPLKELNLHIDENNILLQLKVDAYKPILRDIEVQSQTDRVGAIQKLGKLKAEFVQLGLPADVIDKLEEKILNPVATPVDIPSMENTSIAEDIVYPKVKDFTMLKGRCKAFKEELSAGNGIDVVHQWLVDFFANLSSGREKKLYKKAKKWQDTFGGIISDDIINGWIDEFTK